MRLSLIAAVAANGAIGRDNRLPWRLPADQRLFKSLTMGHHLLMGRRTFESIGRALPGRITVVISRRPDYAPEGVLVASSIEAALRLAAGDEEPFVAGGAEIYAQTLARAHRLYLTRVHQDFEGDTFFPALDETEWELIDEKHHPVDQRNPHACSFLVYQRKAFG